MGKHRKYTLEFLGGGSQPNYYQPTKSYNFEEDMVSALCQRVNSMFDDRYDAYHLTFMFNWVGGRQADRLRQMERELELFYGRLVTRVVRKPRSPSQQKLLPRIVLFPDAPGWGSQMGLKDLQINDGIHYHGIALLPSCTRLRNNLNVHIQENIKAYLKEPSRIARINCGKRIDDRPGYVLDYGAKSIKRGRLPWENMIIFPRALSELSDRR